MIAHSLTPTQWALHEARKARQARQAKAAARVQSNDNARLRLIAAEPEFPLWQRSKIIFDAHVTEYRLAMVRDLAPKKAFIIERAKSFGFTFAQITAKKRNVPLVTARQVIMMEMKEKWGDDISLPEIGRMFGGMDHTTVLHAIRRAQSFRDGTAKIRVRAPRKPRPPKERKPYVKRPPSNRTPNDIREGVVEAHRAGHTIKSEIGKMFGITRHTVRNILIQMGEI
jgi:hypothetical protein